MPGLVIGGTGHYVGEGWIGSGESAAASGTPTAETRYGPTILSQLSPYIAAGFFAFPFTPAVASATPVPPIRQAQLPVARDEAFVAPRFTPFPYTSQELPVGTPTVETRYGLSAFVEPPPHIGARFTAFPYQSVPPAPANPVIAIRYGRAELLRDEAFIIFPQRLEAQTGPAAEAAASPVIAFRYGRDVLWPEPAQVYPFYTPLHYVGEAAANPVIGIRRGQLAPPPAEAFVAARYQRFPFFQPPAPANPVIGVRYGRDILALEQSEPWRHPHYERFPYFEFPPPPASPVIGVRVGQEVLAAVRAWVAGQFLPFPYWQETVIPPVVPPTLVEHGGGGGGGWLPLRRRRPARLEVIPAEPVEQRKRVEPTLSEPPVPDVAPPVPARQIPPLPHPVVAGAIPSSQAPDSVVSETAPIVAQPRGASDTDEDELAIVLLAMQQFYPSIDVLTLLRKQE